MRFRDKVAVVTGGADGIGKATAQLLAAEGAHVAIFDLDARKGEKVAAELGPGRALFVTVDVTEVAGIDNALQQVLQRFGAIDILINNAGIGCLAKTPELPIETWHRVFAVDLHAIFYACRAVIPHMRGRGGGAIVNTASISGLAADYGFTAYNAAKAGVINYTRALAIDHAVDNIRANAVCPGLISTQLLAGLGQSPELLQRFIDSIPMKRAGTPAEIAEVIAFLASDAASYVTGAAFVADGGKTAWTGQPDVTVLLGG